MRLKADNLPEVGTDKRSHTIADDEVEVDSTFKDKLYYANFGICKGGTATEHDGDGLATDPPACKGENKISIFITWSGVLQISDWQSKSIFQNIAFKFIKSFSW